MTDEEAYRIIEETAEKHGLTNEIKYSEVGQFEFKCSMKFEKEEIIIKVDSTFYDIEDFKITRRFNSSND